MNRPFKENAVFSANQSEVLIARLYDHLLYPAAGIQRMSFFQTTNASGITTTPGAVVGSAKTKSDTNMDLNGQMPNGKVFVAQSIEVTFYPGSSNAANTFVLQRPDTFAAVAAQTVNAQIADVFQFYNSGLLTFNVLSKVQVQEHPLGVFPPKVNFALDGYTTTNSATTAISSVNSMKAAGRPYLLGNYGVQLESNMNFDVTLEWPQALALPSGFNARVGVILDGYQSRATQ
jgi:hypothetical protein